MPQLRKGDLCAPGMSYDAVDSVILHMRSRPAAQRDSSGEGGSRRIKTQTQTNVWLSELRHSCKSHERIPTSNMVDRAKGCSGVGWIYEWLT